MKKKTLNIVQLILYSLCFASCFLKMFVYSSYKVWMYLGDVDKVEDLYYNLFTSLHWMKRVFPVLLFILIAILFVMMVCCSVINLLDKKSLSPFVLKVYSNRYVKTALWILPALEIILLSVYMLCWRACATVLTDINDYWLLDLNFNIKQFAFLPFLFLFSALLFSDTYHNINKRLHSEPLANKKRILFWAFRGFGTTSMLIGLIIHLTDHFTASAILYIISPVLIVIGRLIAGFYKEEPFPASGGDAAETPIQPSPLNTAAVVEDDTQNPSLTTTSDVVVIRKYKSLLDDGIITQEEFDAKKKQLLGL